MIETLPTEILIKILRNLDHNDRIKVSFVSRRLLEVATDSRLLKSLTLTNAENDNTPGSVNLRNKENGMLRYFKMETELRTIRLSFERFNFMDVDTSLLASVICNAEAVTISLGPRGEDLSLDQLEEILDYILIPGNSITILKLEHVDFCGIPSQKVATAINNLTEFHSKSCFFDEVQMIETINLKNLKSNLRRLVLDTPIFRSFPTRCPARALYPREYMRQREYK